jgi:hypothetical protein
MLLDGRAQGRHHDRQAQHARTASVTTILNHKRILAIHQAALRAGFTKRRDALLAGIHRGIVSGITRASTPGDQLLVDLNELNDAGLLEDGTAPLGRWLENALHLGEARRETTTFQAALDRVKAFQDDDGADEKEDADDIRGADRRQRDVKMLREAMSFIHIPTLDMFVNDLEFGYISSRTIFTLHAGFEETVSSSLFHLYDRELSSRVLAYQASWNASLAFGNNFFRAGDAYNFAGGGDDSLTPAQQIVWDKLQDAARNLRIALRELLQLIREEYMELDLAQTSSAAWTALVDIERDVTSALARPR